MLDFPDPLDRRPAQVTPAETPGLRGLLTVAVAVVVVAGLYLGRSVLIPFTLAVLLSFLLAPLVNLLRRGHLGRVPSVLLAMLLALAVILALGGLIGTQVAGLADDVPRYVFTIQQKVDTVQRVVLSRIATFTSSLVHQPANIAVNAKPSAAPAGTSAPAGTTDRPRHPRPPRRRRSRSRCISRTRRWFSSCSVSSRRLSNRCPPPPSCSSSRSSSCCSARICAIG